MMLPTRLTRLQVIWTAWYKVNARQMALGHTEGSASLRPQLRRSLL